MPPRFTTVVVYLVGFVLLTLGSSACGSGDSGPVLADKIGQVARIRVDVTGYGGTGERQQFFVDGPDDVAELLKGIGVKQRVHSGSKFKDGEFPALGLTFFDLQGMPHATLNFSGAIGPRNELYAIGDSADYLGAVKPADAELMGRVIARTTPPPRAR